VPTLTEFKDALGSKIDAAMARISSFSVPEAKFCDLNQVHLFEDLPRAIFYWSLRHAPEAVYDINTLKDYTSNTAVLTERIPHWITIQLRFMADSSGGTTGVPGQWQSDDMRDAILAEFGHHPCVADVPLLYRGFTEAPNQYREGIFTTVFTYLGLIFLDGRIETHPLVTDVVYELHVVGAIDLPEEEESDEPVPTSDQVTVTEFVADILEL